jgi:hypothetical protein
MVCELRMRHFPSVVLIGIAPAHGPWSDEWELRAVSVAMGIIEFRACSSERSKISAFFVDDGVKAYDVWDLLQG